MKKIMIGIAIALCAFSFTGCDLITKTTTITTGDVRNPDKVITRVYNMGEDEPVYTEVLN